MEEALAELAAYFRAESAVPDEDLVRLTAAARAGGRRWDAIAAACRVRRDTGITGIISPALRDGCDTGPQLLFRAAQNATRKLTASSSCFPPLTWPCPGCGQQVTDRAATGRPVHVELGHAPGCARLARDEAADAQARRDRLDRLILHSESALGPVQRHWLTKPIYDDCPRCGWHGYFHHYITTIDGDRAAAVCDDCYADLHPDITVTVQFYAVCLPERPEPSGVIRQRTRSDYGPLNRVEIMTWQLDWHHTRLLAEISSGGSCIEDLVPVSRRDAGQITATLAARHWPRDAARLPWVASAYPD